VTQTRLEENWSGSCSVDLHITNTSRIVQGSNRGLCDEKTATDAETAARMLLYVTRVLSVCLSVHFYTNSSSTSHGSQSVPFWQRKHLCVCVLQLTVQSEKHISSHECFRDVSRGKIFKQMRIIRRRSVSQSHFLLRDGLTACLRVLQHASHVCRVTTGLHVSGKGND
jgi:hypothetical protein